MIVKDVSFTDPVENILYDDVLLQRAEQDQSPDVLRFWESPVYFIVLGKIGKREDDVADTHFPILRRSSGGGTVIQGPGCLNYSVIAHKDHLGGLHDLKKSYATILEKVVAGLAELDILAQYLPISDIALCENLKKISGNAQKRTRTHVLHHGTLLYNFDLNVIAHHLTIPFDMPEYRKNRSHLDFVSNIRASQSDLKKVLANAFQVENKEGLLEQEHILLNTFKDSRQVLMTDA